MKSPASGPGFWSIGAIFALGLCFAALIGRRLPIIIAAMVAVTLILKTKGMAQARAEARVERLLSEPFESAPVQANGTMVVRPFENLAALLRTNKLAVFYLSLCLLGFAVLLVLPGVSRAVALYPSAVFMLTLAQLVSRYWSWSLTVNGDNVTYREGFDYRRRFLRSEVADYSLIDETFLDSHQLSLWLYDATRVRIVRIPRRTIERNTPQRILAALKLPMPARTRVNPWHYWHMENAARREERRMKRRSNKRHQL